MPISISWGRKGFGFALALRQTGGLGQSLHLCPSRPLMSPLQPGFHLSTQGAGDTCLAPGCCSCHGRLYCFPCVSGPQGQGLLLFSGGGVLRLPHTWLLSQAEGMLGQRACRSMRVPSTELRRLAQATAAASPNPTLMSQGTLCFPRGDAQAKRLSL